mmetsp:Transcript_83947/g.271263  ORF Transcript_83947/g.271263 Transcript_83947/m.271263 type:complete len:894 (+) Transcript_83947:111-2792(+)
MAPRPPCPEKPLPESQQDDAPIVYIAFDVPAAPHLEVEGPEEEEQELRGSNLLKRCSGAFSAAHVGFAAATAGSFAQGLFWRMRYVELTSHRISYWASKTEQEGGGSGSTPRGEFEVCEIDDVGVHGRQVLIHFASSQRSGRRNRGRVALSLCTNSELEAGQWAEAVRSAAAARLLRVVPSGWNVSVMLSGNNGPVRRVVKAELSDELVQVIQHVVDHAFICKRTRDRRGQEVPVRLQVQKVVSVQNVAAWMNYSEARTRIRGAGSATPTSAYMALEPEVLTATSGFSGSLGWLDEAANEHWLFHGTRVSSAQYITDGEFRMDLAGTHRGTLYGRAVYLAECSSKADEYSEADEEGLCRILLCRSTLGNVLVEREKRPSAPELEEQCRAKYNSVCGDRWAAVGTFREFVLYESSQVYPEYIVYYKRMSQADLLQAIGTISNENDVDGVRKLVPTAARLAQTHPDPQVRYRISLLLGAHAATVVPALTECLRDETALRRRTAAAALGHVADFCSLTCSSLTSMNEDARSQQKIHIVAVAVPALTECLSDSNESVRRAAAQALEQIGPAAAAAVPALAAMLLDPTEDVRCAAAKALARMGGEAASPAVPALAETCSRDSNASVQKAAVAALGQLGTFAVPAVPALIECLRSPNHSVRCAAASSLESLGPSGASAVSALLVCAHDPDVGVRTTASKALGTLGNFVSSSASAAEALCERLLDTHEGVRAAAAMALGRLGVASTIPMLSEALKDMNEDVRKASAIALGQMRGVATPAIPQLTKALKDSNEDVRQAAVVSLGLFGTAANSATRPLTLCLSDTTVSVRKAAAVALGQVGNPSRGVMDRLTERLKDPNEGVRKAAKRSLDQLAKQHAEAEELADAEYEEEGWDEDSRDDEG